MVNDASRPGLAVGLGVDTHRFAGLDDPSRPLWLGGIHFPGETGLIGHSDGDAICHAIADAILGASGTGDLGSIFPDTEPEWAGAPGVALIEASLERAASAGWHPVSVDCSVVTERPRIASARGSMESLLAGVLGCPVRVTGRRAEGLGAIGRVEGLMAVAVVLALREDAWRPIAREASGHG
jgi:2-C-methyl-D-erythritol 2,4-cyclodiphosphate synthase